MSADMPRPLCCAAFKSSGMVCRDWQSCRLRGELQGIEAKYALEYFKRSEEPTNG